MHREPEQSATCASHVIFGGQHFLDLATLYGLIVAFILKRSFEN
jgi:hypothetical protein